MTCIHYDIKNIRKWLRQTQHRAHMVGFKLNFPRATLDRLIDAAVPHDPDAVYHEIKPGDLIKDNNDRTMTGRYGRVHNVHSGGASICWEDTPQYVDAVKLTSIRTDGKAYSFGYSWIQE